MPALAELLARRAGMALNSFTSSIDGMEMVESGTVSRIDKRIAIPCCNSSSPPGLVEANTVDPWSASGKYALGWVYFCIILLVFAIIKRLYNIWTDKIRTALRKEDAEQKTVSPDSDFELTALPSALPTDRSTKRLFPRTTTQQTLPKEESSLSSLRAVNIAMALVRFIFYRPLPVFQIHRLRKRMRPIVFPSIGVLLIVFAALTFVVCYSLVPQPLFWQSIRFGAPPLAIRAGMIAVAMMPWIIALSMKANMISWMTGIGHERLNVLHRWLAYLCLILSIIHTVPFYVTPIWGQGGLSVFRTYFPQNGVYIYGTGIAALVPLIFLCVHSLPPLRRMMYELFVTLHVPVSILYLAMLFWHCKNYLTSWNYLWATSAIWFTSYIVRIFYLNWTNPWRMSWLIGDEAAVTLMPENALKITIPTQVKWKPGQYVYLRMPGISVFENHPFTIASLCSDDFPSAYGEEYRDMVLVFRPFGGFTKRVLESALDRGPWHTYRAFIDGPYGGMTRSMDSFDHVVLFAGGSGITALISQLLDLIKRMREGKAVTKTVQVVWALKRPETMEWFQEELRICREYAPVDAVQCQFFVTAAKRQARTGQLVSAHTPTRPVSTFFHEKVDNAFQNIANNRYSMSSSMNRHSALIADEAAGDIEKEKELRHENEDRIRPLPEAHLVPARTLSKHSASSPDAITAANTLANASSQPSTVPTTLTTPHPTLHQKRARTHANLSVDIPAPTHTIPQTYNPTSPTLPHANAPSAYDFGFPSTPTEFQKNLMRFAFLPGALSRGKRAKTTGWSTEYGRPDIPFMLREMSEGWTGRRICVYVCGPPGMRVDVSSGVAELQRTVWNSSGGETGTRLSGDAFGSGGGGRREEVYLHAENYAI